MHSSFCSTCYLPMFAPQYKLLSLVISRWQERRSFLCRVAWTTHAVQMLKHLRETRWVRTFLSEQTSSFFMPIYRQRQIWAVEIPLQDKDGHAVIIALRPISKDKEVSYYLFISFRLCKQDEKFGYVMLHVSYRSDNEHSRLPSPTSMKTFHTRRGRRNLQIMGSRVDAWNAKKSDRSERRTLLEFCGIWENLHIVYFTG